MSWKRGSPLNFNKKNILQSLIIIKINIYLLTPTLYTQKCKNTYDFYVFFWVPFWSSMNFEIYRLYNRLPKKAYSVPDFKYAYGKITRDISTP